MAIPNMQIGRVEADPMGVPIAASMSKGADDSFARLLQDSVANEQSTPEPAPKAREEQTVPENEVPEAQSSRTEPRDNGTDVDQTDDHGGDSESDTDTSTTDLGADVTESISRGETERQNKTAGKGTDSPRTSTQTNEPLIAATLQSQAANQQQFNGIAPGSGAQNAAAAVRTVEPTIRGTASAAQANGSTPKAAHVQTGYSTKSAQQAQMLEQARDSVFKQILMKLHGDGGEVRMRLDPPDLGQLDLRMTVEGGNKLSLQISAERQDINQLLQRHLDELKLTLQESGLEVTDAEVQTRSEFEQHNESEGNGSGESSAPSDSNAEQADLPTQARGFISAQGLDFWV